jgi:phage shock protein PspC (stress-responsive transcriptional regulator)
MVMKKNISINISGIIFHIEEDGYKKLKDYLDSINKYFSNYEESEEIIADIESRIAELFLEKLDEDGKQVISNEDIDQLVSTMGEISDFEAMEEEAGFTPAGEPKESKTENKSSTKQEYQNTYEKRKLYRDLNNQIVGGVGSGLANYFNADPIWFRVGFLLLLGTGFGLLGYIILWIAVPGSRELKEDESIKKFYRDPDDRVLGGVASGLANYFRTDSIVFRIIFIVLFFGGVGIIAYIVLWIIGPQAKSLTDKMQMKGQKVTLSNIDSNIKRSKEEDLNPKGEGAFTKILLFPFRLIGRIFRAIGSALTPLLLFIAAAFRIFIGAVISVVGISAMFSLLVTAGVLLGLHDSDWFMFNDSDFPLHIFYNTLPEIGILFAFAAIFIPFLYLFIAGITIIAKRKVMSSSVGWSILGIWMISVLGTFATVPNVVRDFREEGYHDVSEVINIEADTVTLSLSESKEYSSEFRNRRRYRRNNSYKSEFTDLDIRVSRDNTWRIDKRATARGRNIEDADRNAEEIAYEYRVTGNEIVFDNELTMREDAEFRFQDLDITLHIPANQPFKINTDMGNLLNYFSYRYNWWEVYRNTWMLDDDGTLICLTCEEEADEENDGSTSNSDSKTFEYSDFEKISVYTGLPVTIKYGETYEVTAEGSSTKFDELNFRINAGNLIISAKDDFNNWRGTELIIQLPELKNLSLNDDANVTVNGTSLVDTRIVLTDQARLQLTGRLQRLSLLALQESRVDSDATIDDLTMEVMDKSRFYGYDGEIVDCKLTTNSEARARLNITEYLAVEANGFSSVRYKGSPKVDIKDKSNSAIISQY